MTDLPARLRQGVIEKVPIYLDDGIDVQATEDLMADAAAELDRLRKIEEAARDRPVQVPGLLQCGGCIELAMGIRSEYLSELTRLRKIEAAVREYMYSEKRIPDINDLNQALETDTDGVKGP
jgi:hypothetical protein